MIYYSNTYLCPYVVTEHVKGKTLQAQEDFNLINQWSLKNPGN